MQHLKYNIIRDIFMYSVWKGCVEESQCCVCFRAEILRLCYHSDNFIYCETNADKQKFRNGK